MYSKFYSFNHSGGSINPALFKEIAVFRSMAIRYFSPLLFFTSLFSSSSLSLPSDSCSSVPVCIYSVQIWLQLFQTSCHSSHVPCRLLLPCPYTGFSLSLNCISPSLNCISPFLHLAMTYGYFNLILGIIFYEKPSVISTTSSSYAMLLVYSYLPFLPTKQWVSFCRTALFCQLQANAWNIIGAH